MEHHYPNPDAILQNTVCTHSAGFSSNNKIQGPGTVFLSFVSKGPFTPSESERESKKDQRTKKNLKHQRKCSLSRCFRSLWRMSVADLRGRKGRAPPGVQILLISCSFGKIWQNRMLAPPWGVGAPSSGKSWIRHWMSQKMFVLNSWDGCSVMCYVFGNEQIYLLSLVGNFSVSRKFRLVD